MKKDVFVLGGGIAGLSAAYFLKKNDIQVTVFEALSEPGGNCRTIRTDEFLYDTGAHRIHDKDSEITVQIKDLMGKHLMRVDAPSKIFDNGRLLSFPLEPKDVFRRMDKRFTFKAGIDLLRVRRKKRENHDFESFAVHAYGRAMAERYLLNYSRKLWGMPCNELSVEVSGERLKSMTIRTLLKNFVSRKYAERSHYEGEFYYPKHGIGQLPRTFIAAIGPEHIRLNSRVTGIFHDNEVITGIQINENEQVAAHQYVSTLPIVEVIRMMRPEPEKEILDAVKSLKFRNLRLAVFFIKGKGINDAATMYFPADKYIFTRGYEPRNRSKTMSPKGRTSFVAEVPCFEDDWMWKADSRAFIEKVKYQILDTGLITKEDIIGCSDERISYAYPVLERDYRGKISKVLEYLSRFHNLEISGRCGLFKYLWIHNLLSEGKNIAGRLAVRM